MMEMMWEYLIQLYGNFFSITIESGSKRGCMIILFGYTVTSHINKDVNDVCLFNMIMMKYCLSFQ